MPGARQVSGYRRLKNENRQNHQSVCEIKGSMKTQREKFSNILSSS